MIRAVGILAVHGGEDVNRVAELEDLADELLEVDGDEGGVIVPLMAAAAAIGLGVLALLIRRRQAVAAAGAPAAMGRRAAPARPATGLDLGPGSFAHLGIVFEETESAPDPRASWSVAHGREEIVERIPPRRGPLP